MHVYTSRCSHVGIEVEICFDVLVSIRTFDATASCQLAGRHHLSRRQLAATSWSGAGRIPPDRSTGLGGGGGGAGAGKAGWTRTGWGMHRGLAGSMASGVMAADG